MLQGKAQPLAQNTLGRFNGVVTNKRKENAMSNQYEIKYELPRSGVGGVHKESVDAASESDARAIVRAKFGNLDVRIVGGHMTNFGGGDDRDDRR